MLIVSELFRHLHSMRERYLQSVYHNLSMNIIFIIYSPDEALKYLSFPTQVLSKSCKIIPVMLVGILINKKHYPLLDYLEALAITAGVALFTFSEKSGSQDDNKTDSFFGVFLIISYLACDSFTSQWQSKVYKQYGVDQYQMMFGINFWSIFFTGKIFSLRYDVILLKAYGLISPRAALNLLQVFLLSRLARVFSR